MRDARVISEDEGKGTVRNARFGGSGKKESVVALGISVSLRGSLELGSCFNLRFSRFARMTVDSLLLFLSC